MGYDVYVNGCRDSRSASASASATASVSGVGSSICINIYNITVCFLICYKHAAATYTL